MRVNRKYFLLACATLLSGVIATFLFWPEQKTLPASRPSEQPAKTDFVAERFRDSLKSAGLGPLMVKIDSAVFAMGSAAELAVRDDDERLHEVRIEKPFAIGVYEVSFEEFDRYSKATGTELLDDEGWGRGKQPVINVTWHEALAYTRWLSAQTGHHYRLPSEAEWEYSARAGTTSAYWWGDSAQGSDKAICSSGCADQRLHSPAAVGSRQANPFAIYDVSGNVWEWTCSNYVADYDGSEQICAADSDDEVKAIRGGAWINSIQVLRVAKRDKFVAGDKNEIVGFRVLRDL